MDYKYILFDLDGTLTDSGLGITKSVQYALEKLGIVEKDRTKLYKFIGPPLAQSFMMYYGFCEEDAARAIQYYREYFRDRGIFENEVYDGMEALLADLREQGRELIVATSKPEEFALRILEHFDLKKYFTNVTGATMSQKRVKKVDVINEAMKRSGISAASDVLMIGDREYDIAGAHEAGIPAMGVLYGYGSRAELEAAGADYIVETVEDITRVLA